MTQQVDEAGAPVIPENDQQLRVVCMRIAASCFNPDAGIAVNALVQCAESLVRYAKEGTIPEPPSVTTISGGKRHG